MFEQDKNFKVVNDAYPRIGEKIRLFWGCPELVVMMRELHENSSERPRAGFPADVFFALDALESMHNANFPDLALKPKNFWEV